MTTPKCPACPGRREHRHYLCPTCWNTLPASTRTRLTLRDTHTHTRLRELHTALHTHTPLQIIRVSR